LLINAFTRKRLAFLGNQGDIERRDFLFYFFLNKKAEKGKAIESAVLKSSKSVS